MGIFQWKDNLEICVQYAELSKDRTVIVRTEDLKSAIIFFSKTIRRVREAEEELSRLKRKAND